MLDNYEAKCEELTKKLALIQDQVLSKYRKYRNSYGQNDKINIGSLNSTIGGGK